VSDRLRLDARQTADFRCVIEHVLRTEAEAFASGFVTTGADRLRALPTYYAALNGAASFPTVQCNAPWVSAVIEANGAVRPCFFHDPVGNVRQKPFDAIMREDFPGFRQVLDVARNDRCRRCVCSIKVGVRNMPWR
jgi:MoaA/NifB/PqqE/SkfB family radical SAM enzyme